MSRIGKLPVECPQGVNVSINSNLIVVEGSLGKLERHFNNSFVNVIVDANQVVVSPKDKTEKKCKEQWGLVRSLVANMVKGVSTGFQVKLDVLGVGYKVSVKENILTLYLGHSHDIKVLIPSYLTIKCPTATSVEIFGSDKEKVGQFAATIRSLRPPEPYKGKGVRYSGETVFRKEGKKK